MIRQRDYVGCTVRGGGSRVSMVTMTTSPVTRRRWPTVVQVGPDPSAVGGMETVIRTYADLLSAHTSVRVIPSWRPDAPAAGLLPALNAARSLARLRGDVVVHVHLSQRGAFCREGVLVRAAAPRQRVYVTVHGSDFVATSRSRRWSPIYRAVLRRAAGVAVLNDDALAAVRRLVPRTPVRVLRNPGPVPPRWVPPIGAGAAGPVVLFAGEVSARKGADVLLRAWPTVLRAVPGARLVVAGPDGGVDLGAVPGAVGDVFPGAGVQALGPVSPERIRQLLGEARVAVLPSRAEGMPMFVLEAMAAGRPVVGTTVGAMPQMLRGAGLVVQPGAADRLAEALVAYLSDRDRADRDGAVGRARYLRGHSPETTVQDLAAFYGLAAAGRPDASADPSRVAGPDASGAADAGDPGR